MCGFICFFSNKNLQTDTINSLEDCSKTIIHRGPDKHNSFVDKNFFMSFNRLSILDLNTGNQPFHYKNRYVTVFNGEIYNYKDIIDELKEDYSFVDNTEVETITFAYDKWGESFINKLRGMFAIIIFDRQKNKFVAYRDYFGIKPIYYMQLKDGVVFSSEAKAIYKFSDKQLNILGLNNYLSFQYIPEPSTPVEDIHCVPTGCYITNKKEILNSLSNNKNNELEIVRFFNPALTPCKKTNKEDLKKEIVDTLRNSVEKHLKSDVPVATFLSGGIDSSIITKLASEFNSNLTTFSIGFQMDNYNEVPLAKQFAQDIGVKNINLTINHEDLLEEIYNIVYHMDIPVADPSIIPLYFVTKEASKYFKVVLSGEGSDELFGGYNIYTEENSLKVFKYIPKKLKQIIAKIAYNNLPINMKGRSFLIRGCTELKDRYIGNANIFEDREKFKLIEKNYIKKSHLKVTDSLFNSVKNLDPVSQRQYIDLNTWLIGDILSKTDRMSMAHSLEVRVPFLDKEVFDLCSKLHKEDKINNFTTKHLLREAFKDILPSYLYDRKKLGYPVPIRVWFKNELYSWAKNTIQNTPLDIFDKSFALNLLELHKEGHGDYSRKLWTIIIYILWYEIHILNIRKL